MMIKNRHIVKKILEIGNLRNADLSYADLRNADLSYADLSYSNLRNADLRNADLSYSNLRNADLSYADLRNADLSYSIGNMKELHSMQLEKYMIVFTDEMLAIGCEKHKINDWLEFADDEIERMDYGALEFWNKWKVFIFKAIELCN